jgi:hypothetical protein
MKKLLKNKTFYIILTCVILPIIVSIILKYIPSPSDKHQTMTDSSGSAQSGRDINIKINGDVISSRNQSGGITAKTVNINTDRRLSAADLDNLIRGLKANPCAITVGVLGMGGEPDYLANQLLEATKSAGCQTKGVYHGVGFPAFTGLQIKFSVDSTPTATITVIENVFQDAKVSYTKVPDKSQPSDSIYLYVGYKP